MRALHLVTVSLAFSCLTWTAPATAEDRLVAVPASEFSTIINSHRQACYDRLAYHTLLRADRFRNVQQLIGTLYDLIYSETPGGDRAAPLTARNLTADFEHLARRFAHDVAAKENISRRSTHIRDFIDCKSRVDAMRGLLATARD